MLYCTLIRDEDIFGYRVATCLVKHKKIGTLGMDRGYAIPCSKFITKEKIMTRKQKLEECIEKVDAATCLALGIEYMLDPFPDVARRGAQKLGEMLAELSDELAEAKDGNNKSRSISDEI